MIAIFFITVSTFGQTTEVEKILEARYPSAIVVEQSTSGGWYNILYNYGTANVKAGACNLNGKEVIPPNKYSSVNKYGNETDGYYYAVKIGDKEGACDLTGKEIIPPNKYSSVSFSQNGEYGGFFVKIGDKEGLCDLTGKEIIPCQYEGVCIMYRGTIHLKKNGEYVETGIKIDKGSLYSDYNSTNNYQNSQPQKNIDSGLKLYGSWSISYENVKLEGKIENTKPENWVSGTPLLKVIMRTTPYNGTGELTGHLYCQNQISQIKGGYIRTIDEKNITYTKPPVGTYYVILGLYEYNNGDYVLVDYLTFNGTRTYYAETSTNNNNYQPSQSVQKDYSFLKSQYYYWEGQVKNYYQLLGSETDASLRMTYLSGYKQAQAQMQQIRPQAAHVIQQSAFEFAQPPSNPGK